MGPGPRLMKKKNLQGRGLTKVTKVEKHCLVYFIPYRDPSVGVIYEQFYITPEDGVVRGMISAIWMAYCRQ